MSPLVSILIDKREDISGIKIKDHISEDYLEPKILQSVDEIYLRWTLASTPIPICLMLYQSYYLTGTKYPAIREFLTCSNCRMPYSGYICKDCYEDEKKRSSKKNLIQTKNNFYVMENGGMGPMYYGNPFSVKSWVDESHSKRISLHRFFCSTISIKR